MITINRFDDVVTPAISGDLLSVLVTMLTAENPSLFEMGAALNDYEQRLIAATVPVPEMPTISAGEIAELQQQIADRDATIAHLTARLQTLAPNLAEILPALLEAGLTAWADRAVTTYNESHLEGADSLMPIVAQLYAAASSNAIAAVPPLFGEIMQRSMVAPTSDEATAMQVVLDGVKFPSELVNFYPWIKQ